MKNKISIIVPVYNCETTLKRALNSVINQTYKNFELIIINDGSTDKSDMIITEYINQLNIKYSNKVIYIKQDNKGVSSARNTGLEKCTGDYIAFLDADDWLESSYFENIVNDIKGYDIIYYSYKVNNKTIKCDNRDKLQTKQLFIEQMYNCNLFNPICNKVVKKEVIKNIKFREDIDLGEDCIFYLQALNNSKTYRYINKSFYNYEATYNGLGFRSREDIFLAKFKLVQEMELVFKNNNFDLSFIDKLYAKAYIVGFISLSKNHNLNKKAIIAYRNESKKYLNNSYFHNISKKYNILLKILNSNNFLAIIIVTNAIKYLDILNKKIKFKV